MRSAKSVGRVVGLLMLIPVVGGVLANFVFLGPVMADPPGFLANAAGSAVQVRVAVLLAFVAGAVNVAIAIVAWQVFRRYSHIMALWLLALGVVLLSLVAVEGVALLSMLSLSQEYAQAGGADGFFQALGAVACSARNWAHYTVLLVGAGWLGVFYTVFFRFALIPRALAAFALVALALQIMGVVLPPFLGHRGVLLLVAPLGLAHLAVALWLLAKGLQEPPDLARGDAGVL